MSVIEDVQSRITAINQAFSGLASTGVQTTGVGSSIATYGSEFESALASASTIDLPASPDNMMSSSEAAVMGSAVTGADVVADAKQYLGVPYVYGGTDPSKGLDCSALVQRAYADLGVDLPRTSQEQATMGAPVASLAQAQPGDLVCFGSPATHIGIYAGDGKMVVAPHTGTNVQVQEITQTPSTIRRILSDTPVAATVAARPAALSTNTTGWPTGAAAYATAFAAAEKKYNLPNGLLSAVAHAESNYRPDAVSSAGAIGLMQLMPATAKAFGVDPTNPAQAIDGAARLLQGQLNKYGSVSLALAAYNAGGPAVDKYDGIPPYAETQNYVRKVMAYMNEAA